MKFEADMIIALQNAGDGWITFFKIITLLGSWLGFAIALMPLFFKEKKLSYFYVATFLFGVLFNLLLKNIIQRPRPFETWEDIQNLGNADGWSMPSSHSMCGAIIAVFLIYLILSKTKSISWKIFSASALTLFSLLIGFSRMILGVHYLTDVIAGIIEGILLACIAIFVYNKLAKKTNKGKNKNEIV